MHNAGLVFFTLLIQIAVGIFGSTLFTVWTATNGVVHMPLIILSVCLALIFLGLISAMTHLGNPRNAPHAIVNITHSWLSREIVAIHLFAMGILLIWMYTVLDIQQGLFIFEIATLISGIGAVLAMGKVYRLRTVPVWNHIATPLDFWGTAVLTGNVASAVLNGFISENGQSPDSGSLILWVLGLGLKLFSLFARGSVQKRSTPLFWYASIRKKTCGKISTHVIQACLYTLAVAVSGAGSRGMISPPDLFVTAALAVLLATEIWNRFLFYDAFGRLGV